jgi:HD superfamily phosphodiesterase
LNIAKQNFTIPEEMQELLYSAIILHDIGGSEINDQYEKGPAIATKLLKQLEYSDNIINEICQMIRTHHEKLENPSEAFKILYDADQLAKFSKEEFSHYNSKSGFNWEAITNSMYAESSKKLATEMLNQRKQEVS